MYSFRLQEKRNKNALDTNTQDKEKEQFKDDTTSNSSRQ
jgi:hypothetical protein